MRMYVWTEVPSLYDYSNGMVCAIARTKKEAIELAVCERHPYVRKHPQRPAAWLKKLNTDVDAERAVFREELIAEDPLVITRGAVHIAGGG